MDHEQNWYNGQMDAPEITPSPAPEKKSGLHGKVIALVLSAALIGGLTGFGGAMLAGTKGHSSTVLEGVREPTVINISQVNTGKLLTAAEVYAANVNSTVGITTSAVTTNFWGIPVSSAAAGSGFIFSDDGYILTNYHVIEGATSVKVALFNGEEYDASLVGYDASNDIAVLKIDAQGLTPVVLGNSDTLNVGDDVVAIGNPLGEFTFSLTKGSVSALNREVTLSNGTSRYTMDLIQTDCAINSGNSGGALFNLYGEVVGITNAKYSNNGNASQASIESIGFAIPINQVRSIVDSIIENGYIAKPYIGVSVRDVSEESQSYGLPQGASVAVVNEDGPAQKAGVQVNDIITAVNGESIDSSDALVAFIKTVQTGDELTLTIYRQGQTLDLTVTVEDQVQAAIQENGQVTQQNQAQQNGQNFDPWSFFYGQ